MGKIYEWRGFWECVSANILGIRKLSKKRNVKMWAHMIRKILGIKPFKKYFFPFVPENKKAWEN